ncbi:hypothetical protein B0H14DRAFT_3483832 [Mycena olivaceomarginata]|nr:hypothetical protein B0H14DRAFT_3483832 [Mycena olivaceomarginata]
MPMFSLPQTSLSPYLAVTLNPECKPCPALEISSHAVSPPSRPWQRGRRVHRALRSESESPPRRSSEPPTDSPRIIIQDPNEHVTSDDIIFTPHREKKIMTQRAQLKPQETLAAKKVRKEEELLAELAAERERVLKERLAKEQARNAMFDRFLEEMHTKDASVADFMDYVFNPENKFDKPDTKSCKKSIFVRVFTGDQRVQGSAKTSQ